MLFDSQISALLQNIDDHQDCLKRFRPIIMPTMAAMLGAVQLAIGFGAGAELRCPLGTAIVGGLLVSRLLTLYTTSISTSTSSGGGCDARGRLASLGSLTKASPNPANEGQTA